MASIATVPTKGKLLQMRFTQFEHYIPDQISRMIALQLLLRNVLVRLLNKQMQDREDTLHRASYFFLVEFIRIGDDFHVRKMNKEHVRTALEGELNIQFCMSGQEQFRLTHLYEAKRKYFEITNHKLYPGDDLRTTIRPEAFLHSRHTHINEYSNPNRSSLGGNRLNSRYNTKQLSMDKIAYEMCDLSISDADTTENTFRQDEHFRTIAQDDLTKLYKSFININYRARDEEMTHVNEIINRTRTSIHVLPCGFGKTTLYLVPAAINLLMWVHSNKDTDNNVYAAVSNLIESRMPAGEALTKRLVHEGIQALSNSFLNDSWRGSRKFTGGCTLIFVPVVSLARALENRISKSNLIRVKAFERSAFVKQMGIYKDKRDLLPTVDVWICTYTMGSLLMDLLRTAAKTGYLREVVYDEAHSFLNQFLTFHQNLKVLMLRNADIPIICVTGTLTKRKEQHQLQDIVSNALDDKYRAEALTPKEDNDDEDNDDQQVFDGFKNSNGIHRCFDTMPRNLVHYTIQPRQALNVKNSLALVSGILESIFKNGDDKLKKEVGDVIVFLPTRDLVEQMKSIFDNKKFRVVTLTGNHEDKDEQQLQVNEFVSEWINGDTTRIALCTTAASVGIDNEKCKTVISIGVYYGLRNYVQCASRAARSQTEQGRSIFIASSEKEFNLVNDYYTQDDDAKMERLTTYGARDPCLDQNESLRKIVGPFKEKEAKEREAKKPCVHCQLTHHFDDRNTADNCTHMNNSEDSDLVCRLKKALEKQVRVPG